MPSLNINSNIVYDTNTHKKIIEYIRDNIITDPVEFIESEEEINRVAAKEENIKLYRFIQEIEDMDSLQILNDDINELKKVLTDNILLELEFHGVLSCNGQL
ncbi:MAG: hypothetical protein IJJ47_02815 [Methanosphaera sp.]|nr:hypothetical protein [Methanosphaera sp.]